MTKCIIHKHNEKADKLDMKIKGVWYDEIYHKDNTGNIKLLETTPKKSNLITEPITRLIAGLMSNDASLVGGILYHAVGEGEESWDVSPSAPVWADIKLFSETYRKIPDSINYVDADGHITSDITNRIKIKTTFDFNEANNKWIREQGLFGGKASLTKDSGYMVDSIRHVKIWKDNSLRIVRTIELTF